MKKGLVIVLLAAAAGGLFAQEQEQKTKNTITAGFEVGVIHWFIPCYGFIAEFERIVLGNNLLGVSVEAGTGVAWAVFPETHAAARARLYPFSGMFFMDAGLGYRFVDWNGNAEHLTYVPVSIGWKVDVGRPGAFVGLVHIGMDIALQSQLPSNTPSAVQDLATAMGGGLNASVRIGYTF